MKEVVTTGLHTPNALLSLIAKATLLISLLFDGSAMHCRAHFSNSAILFRPKM